MSIELLGHPDQPPVLRPTEEMHWYLWEAVIVDLNTLQLLKLAPPDLVKEASDISEEVRNVEVFRHDLKERACRVELEIKKYSKELEAHYESEFKKAHDAAVNGYPL